MFCTGGTQDVIEVFRHHVAITNSFATVNIIDWMSDLCIHFIIQYASKLHSFTYKHSTMNVLNRSTGNVMSAVVRLTRNTIVASQVKLWLW